MTIYEDYLDWKNENYDLINELIKMKSNIISRISHVIAVVEYLYNEHETKGVLEDYLENIFEYGFNYLHDRFLTISNILNKEFRRNLVKMNEISKTINLLLYVNDFQDELDNLDEDTTSSKEKLDDFEQKVYSYIEKGEEAPDEMFGLLDDLTFDMFDNNYKGINDIMYDVAIELDLINVSEANEAIDNVFGIMDDEL